MRGAREFKVLGPLEVLVDGEPVALGGQRRRALLTRLLLDANRTIPAERLIDDLWGERARPTTANALQVAVSALRQALDPGREGVLTHVSGGYVLRVEPGQLDTERFDTLAAEGRARLAAGNVDAALDAFDAAIACHRGLPLVDLAGEPCAQPEIERLLEAHHAVAEDRIEALLAAGRHADAVPQLERLVREAPLRERRWSQLLLALYRSGRQADALRAYEAVRTLLLEELGVTPSPALRDLEQAILEQRPELDLAPAPVEVRGPVSVGTSTVVLTDIVGSTELAQRLGDAAYERIRATALTRIRAQAAAHGGSLVNSAGDGVLLRFSSATRALRCAVAIQEGSRDDPIQLRVGVDAGEPIETDDHDVVGTSINRAARLCGAAEPGEVLVSGVVRALVESRNEHRFGQPRALLLKGFGTVQEAHPVLWDGSHGSDGSGATDGRVGGPAVRRPRRHPAPLVTTDEYVGREAELDAARAAWRRARAGERVVLAVTGEPGAGKTRLCAELSQVAARAGAVVAYGRCERDGGGHQPVARAVARLVDDLDDADLHAALGALAPDLAAVVPEVADRLPGILPVHGVEPELQRHRIAEAVGRVVAATATSVPPVVVLDDLHWADATVVSALSHLGGGDGPLLLVAAYRHTDVTPATPVVAALADLRRQGRVSEIELTGLDPDEVSRCVQARAGRACTPTVAAVVHQRTGGNPLLVEELTRALVAADALERDEVDDIDVPTGVRDLVTQRLAGLGQPAASVLEAAAVFGIELDWEVLPVVTRLDEDVVAAALDRAVAAGILIEVRGTAGRYAFGHDLLHQAVYESVGAARRSSLHRRAATALQDLRSAGAAEIARHLVAGATLATAQDAALAAVVAAEDALSRVAHDEAARWYAAALGVLGRQADDVQRALLLLGRGEALAAAGELEPAVSTLWEAAAAARSAEDPASIARAALALAGPSMGAWAAYGAEDPELTALQDEAVARLDAEDPLRARVLACRATCRTIPDPSGARRDAAEALAIADALDDRQARWAALYATHWVTRGPDLAARVAVSDRLLAMVDESTRRSDAVDALLLRLADLVELGRLAEADALVETIAELAAPHDPVAGWAVRRYRAMRRALAGDLTGATALASEALEVGQRVQPANAVGSFGALLSAVRFFTDDLSGLADTTAALADADPAVSSYRVLEAFFAAEAGDLARARRVTQQVLERGIPEDNNWLSSHAVLAVPCHYLGDVAAARVLRDALEPCAGRHVAAGSFVVSLGPVDRSLALLAEVLDDLGAADRHAASAEAWCREVGGSTYLAIVLAEQASRLLDRDPVRARELAGEARQLSESLGLRACSRKLAEGGLGS